jgi:hypothetical protein
VLNGEGLQTRYEDPHAQIERIITEAPDSVVPLIQSLYREPVRDELIAQRVREIKEKGGKAVLSFTPLGIKHASVAIEAGVDAVVIQSSATTAQFKSSKGSDFDLTEICNNSPVPVIIGNCCDYRGALSLMEAGAAAVLVGVGPARPAPLAEYSDWACRRERRSPMLLPRAMITKLKADAMFRLSLMAVYAPAATCAKPSPVAPMA